jgi:F-type H+-transporting ATPase subunit delta
MAETATIARPYAEALLKASANGDSSALAAEVQALAEVASNPDMRVFADNPKVASSEVFDVLTSVARMPNGAPSEAAKNLLRAVIDNNRLAVLPEIAAQFQALVNRRTGTTKAVVHTAFALSDAQLADVREAMERRFGRKLEATSVVDPELIGGVRVVVGDEVLDTSIRARLDQMKAALTA